MIGLEDNQEKVVMLWRSLRADIRQEMYRDKLDPEVSSWDEVTTAAEHAEIILNLNHSENDQDSEPNNGDESGHSDDADNPGNGGRESRNASSTVVRISSGKRAENKSAGTSNSARGMSEKKRNQYLAAGLCFKCGVQGHLARNCPELTVVVSKQKGKPPGIAAHGVEFVEPSTPDALYESTEVLDTLDVGASSFLGAGMIVEEGEGTRNFGLNFSRFPRSVDESTANNRASSTEDFEHTDSMISGTGKSKYDTVLIGRPVHVPRIPLSTTASAHTPTRSRPFFRVAAQGKMSPEEFGVIVVCLTDSVQYSPGIVPTHRTNIKRTSTTSGQHPHPSHYRSRASRVSRIGRVRRYCHPSQRRSTRGSAHGRISFMRNNKSAAWLGSLDVQQHQEVKLLESVKQEVMAKGDLIVVKEPLIRAGMEGGKAQGMLEEQWED
ncbi:hypothetical protein B0H10DRAFT_2233089 [Mycena sp. CBHHK59/15]|nr:hypothetical protein B0H10DRAFT_2233089 [Mycena sp. CBHHK59/15]